MLHLSEFVRTLRSSVLVVFNNFLLIDATDKNKISSDQKRFFIALSVYPLSFFANTPFNVKKKLGEGGVRAKELVNKYRVELRQKSETAILYFFHAAGVLRTFVQ